MTWLTIGASLTITDTTLSITSPLPTGTINARLGHDGTDWTALRSGWAMIVANDLGGAYTIAEQVWDVDLGIWVDFGVTVTGDGGGDDGSPNGDYISAGTYGGRVYYEIAGGAFVAFTEVGSWYIAVYTPLPGDFWSHAVIVEGTYDPFGMYMGNPVVAATTLAARDVSDNADGSVGDYVFFWQQYNDNGDIETVCLVTTQDSLTAHSPTTSCPCIYAFDEKGRCLGWWVVWSEAWESPWGFLDPGWPVP